MDSYLTALDPAALGPEFPVVLDAVAGHELGIEALTYARQAIDRWHRDRYAHLIGQFSSDDPAAHLHRWRHRIRELDSAGGNFADLRRLCTGPEWAAAEESRRQAKAVKDTQDFLKRHYSTPPTAEMNGTQGTDLALRHLIDQLDPDESRMHEDMGRLRSVVERHGETESPTDLGDGPAGVTIGFHTLLERAIFEPDAVPLGYPARHLAFASVSSSLRQALIAQAASAKARFPEHFTLTVGDWSRKVPAKPVTQEVKQRLISDLAEHAEHRTTTAVDSVDSVRPRVAQLAIGVVVILALMLWQGGPDGLGSAICGVLLIGLIWRVIEVPLRRRRLREEGDRHRTAGTVTLERALAQHDRMCREWQARVVALARDSWLPTTVELPTPRSEE